MQGFSPNLTRLWILTHYIKKILDIITMTVRIEEHLKQNKKIQRKKNQPKGENIYTIINNLHIHL